MAAVRISNFGSRFLDAKVLSDASFLGYLWTDFYETLLNFY